MTFPMTPEMEFKMWCDRVQQLEKGIEEAVKALKILRDSAAWTGAQRAEIDRKIEHIENMLIPF
jgi:hypothetical protein